MSRLRRFLHLERPRPAADGAQGSGGAADRFGGLERPRAGPGAPTASGAELGRFGPDPEPTLQLVEADAALQPFTRCMRCGADHNVFATRCSSCDASLDTEAQRVFNERLWTQRREEAAREEAAAAERRALAATAEAEVAGSRRALAEELAREVGRRERARLEAEGLGGGFRLPGGDRLGRALRRLLGARKR